MTSIISTRRARAEASATEMNSADVAASAYRGIDRRASDCAQILGCIPLLLDLATCVSCRTNMHVDLDIPEGIVYRCAGAFAWMHRLDIAACDEAAWEAYLLYRRRASMPYRRCDTVTKRALLLIHVAAVQLDPRPGARRLIAGWSWRDDDTAIAAAKWGEW